MSPFNVSRIALFFSLILFPFRGAAVEIFPQQMFGGSPHTIVHNVNFSAPLLVGYSLVIENGGGGNGNSNRVTDIQITLNGSTVFIDSDFHGKPGYSVAVPLMSQNQMSITLHGNSFSFVKIRIVGEQALPPVPVMVVTPDSGTVPLAASFSAVGSYDPNAGIITSYAWSFGDGSTASDIISTHTYTQPGTYEATLTVTNNFGLSASTSRLITVMNDTTAPFITIQSPLSGAELTSLIVPVSGTSNEPLSILTVNGMQIPLSSDGLSFSGIYTSPNDGSQNLAFAATDLWGNTSTTNVSVSIALPTTIPPDPATIAPPLPAQQWTSTIKQIEFLFSGPDAIQTGVAPGTISELKGAALRGRLVASDGSPIKGVRVTALNRPEFGQTYSRLDGYFDFVFNVTEGLMLQFEKEGFLTAQRSADIHLHFDGQLEDVILGQVSTVVSPVNLGSEIQLAQGETITDEDGRRSSAVLLPSGTTAQIMMPNGSLQPVGGLSLRISELTQGRDAVSRLPAPLPPFTGYTYAIDISADEATAVGASSVIFNKTVYNYVDDFLDVPPGTLVPSGFFNYKTGKWEAAKNGVVIRVLSIVNDMAIIDADGSGNPASVSLMTKIGYTSEEAQTIASVSQVGKTYWRMPIDHLSVYSYGFVARGLNMQFGAGEAPVAVTPPRGPHGKICGSIIDPQTQTLGESVPVFGTSMSLNYTTDRTPAYAMGRSYRLKLTQTSVSPDILRIVLNWKVAGRSHTETVQPTEFLTTNFTWDGLDAFGRAVQSSVPGEVTVTYVFRSSYGYYLFGANEAQVPYGLGVQLPGGIYTQIDRSTASLTRTMKFIVEGAWTPRDFNGWSLNEHHYYDGRNLYLGTGETVRDQDYSGQIKNHANEFVDRASAAPDGTLFFSTCPSAESCEVRKIDPSGENISTVANAIAKIEAVDSNTFYMLGRREFSDPGAIYRVSSGSFEKLVGSNPNGTCSLVNFPPFLPPYLAPCDASNFHEFLRTAFTVSKNGDVYYTALGDHVHSERLGIHRYSNGRVYAFAGSYNGLNLAHPVVEGAPALGALMTNPDNLVVDSSSNVYFVNYEGLVPKIWKIDQSGMLHLFGGGGATSLCSLLDGGKILDVAFNINQNLTLQLDSSDNILLTSKILGPWATWSISPTGEVKTLSGTKAACANKVFDYQNGGFALGATNLGIPAIDNFGNLYTTGPAQAFGTYNLKKVLPVLASSASENITITSPSGSEKYIFDRNGTHLETRSTLTGALKFKFDYNGGGYLSAIHDIDDNITTVSRDGNGDPVAITTPDGVVTSLAVGSDGFLSSVSNSQGDTFSFSYYAGGLLGRFNSPNGSGSTMTYTTGGLLTRDQDDRGGYTALVASLVGGQVMLQTAEGSASGYNYSASAGNNSWSFIDSSGLSTQTDKFDQITSLAVAPNGTRVEESLAPDPRLGLPSVYTDLQKTTTPNGIVFSSTRLKTVQGLDPVDNNIFSMLTDSTTINGNRFYTSVFTSFDRTWTSTSPEGRVQVVSMNEKEKVSQTRTGTLTPVNFSYDSRGRVSSSTQSDRTTIYGYDDKSFVESVTDSDGKITRFEYDDAGRVISKTLPDNRVIGYSYDRNGNLIGVTPPGKPQHSMFYDLANLLGVYTPPSVGTGNFSTTWNYDLDRRLTSIIKPGGLAATYTYEQGSGRLSSIVTNDGSQYTRTYDSVGRLSSISFLSESMEYSYDGDLLVNTLFKTNGTAYGSLGYAYNNNFQVSTHFVNGQPLAMSYDRDGLLIQVGSQALTYDSNGLLATRSVGGMLMTYGYNEFGELTSYSAKRGAVNYLSYALVRDPNGKIVQKTETESNGTTSVYDYTFDTSGRLTEVRINGVLRQQSEYDANSNRILFRAFDLQGQLIVTYGGTFDDQDRMRHFDGFVYTYNDNGDVASSALASNPTNFSTFSYDVFGNLRRHFISGTNNTFDYIIDGQNRLIGRKRNGVTNQRFLYDGPKVVAELDGNNNLVSRFVYGSNDHSPDYMIRLGVLYVFVSDHLGGPRYLVRSTDGAIVQTLNYETVDAFGSTAGGGTPGGTFQPFGFAGGLALNAGNSGIIRFGARDYHAQSGRWASKDPILFNGGDTNLYGYAMNDPVNFIDPSGLKIYDRTGDPRMSYVRQTDIYKYLDQNPNVSVTIGYGTLPNANWYGSTLGGGNSATVTLSRAKNQDPSVFMNTVVHELTHASDMLGGNSRVDDFLDRSECHARDVADPLWPPFNQRCCQ